MWPIIMGKYLVFAVFYCMVVLYYKVHPNPCNLLLLNRQDELEEDKVQHLPSFLEALSCIVQELDEVIGYHI